MKENNETEFFGCRKECSKCKNWQITISECANAVERNICIIQDRCKEYTDEQTAKNRNETDQKLAMLQDKCFTLEALILSVKTTANLVLGLSVAIAVINFFIVLGGVLIGCGCVHVDACKCVYNTKSLWSVWSCVLAGLVMLASIVMAIVEFLGNKKHSANRVKINFTSIIIMVFISVICVVGLVVSICA